MTRHIAPISQHLAKVCICGCLLLGAAPGLADECSEVHRGRVPNPHGNQIKVVPESAGAPIDHDAIEEAVAMWGAACAENVPGFGEAGNIVMRLRFHDGPNNIPGCGDGCACTISNTRPAPGGEYLASAITHLFERHRNGRGFCQAHREETVAHEIGHVLGFRHPDDPYSYECSGLIMSFSRNRSVRAADCRALTALWQGDGSHGRWIPSGEAASVPSAETEGELKKPRRK